MSTLKVSLLQMDCRIADPEYNFLTARSYLEMAAHDKADLAVLPELWASSYALDRVEEFADPLVNEPTPDNAFGRFAALARDMNLTVAGSLLERADDGIYNTMVVYDREGRLLSSYRKVHLVPMLQEEEFLTAGDALSTVALDGHEAGLAICYDLRFPELFQIYTRQGCRMQIMSAQWPDLRQSHWQALVRSRAIENQTYMVACNGVGEFDSIRFCGHSAIVDPWGEVLVDAGTAPGVYTVECDLGSVDGIRQAVPVLATRRPEVYARAEKQAAAEVPAVAAV